VVVGLLQEKLSALINVPLNIFIPEIFILANLLIKGLTMDFYYTIENNNTKYDIEKLIKDLSNKSRHKDLGDRTDN